MLKKLHTALLAILAILHVDNANGQTFAWTDSLVGVGTHIVHDVAIDGSGNSVIVGEFEGTMSTGSVSLTADGLKDAFIIMYNPQGVAQWGQKIGGTGGGQDNEVAFGVDVDIAGNIYVVGCTKSSTARWHGGANPLVDLPNQGNDDAYIAKYNSSGDLLLVSTPSGSNKDIAFDVTVDLTDVYMVGSFRNSCDFGGAPQNNLAAVNQADGFLAKYDQNLVIDWATQVEGAQMQECLAVVEDGSFVYATGYSGSAAVTFNGSPNITLSDILEDDIWTAQFAKNNGRVQWAVRAGNILDDRGHDLDIIGTSLFVTGYFTTGLGIYDPSDNLVTTSAGFGLHDIFVIEYDLLGNELNHWVEGGTGNDQGSGISGFGGTNLLLGGNFTNSFSFSGTGAVSASPINSADTYLASYQTNGSLNWVNQTSSTGNDTLTCVHSNGSNAMIGGAYDGAAISIPTTSPTPANTWINGQEGFIAYLNQCAGPSIVSCSPDVNVSADPTCNYTIGNYIGATVANDDCGTGSLVITQSPTPGSTLPAGEHTITMTATDGNGDFTQCTFILTIEADVNPIVVDCGDLFLNENTLSDDDTQNNWTCSGVSTPGTDVYYQITVPTGNYLLGISMDNVSDANDSRIETFWMGAGCPTSNNCLEHNRFDLGSQTFPSTGQNQIIFNAAGPGTYWFVVDSRSADGVDNYDIAFNCIVSGIEFDESGCGLDGDNDGVYATVDGSPILNIEPCESPTICQTLYTQNVIGGEWLDTLYMDLGPCYTNVSNLNPDAPGPNGFYDGAGTWDGTYNSGTNSIEWAFSYSGAQDWGDGFGGIGYNCREFTFCFEADIVPGCNTSSDLDIEILIEDDGVNGAIAGVSPGFDYATSSFNLVDPLPTISCPANISVNNDPGVCTAVVNGIAPTGTTDNCPSPTITYILSGATTGSGSNDASGETFNLGITTVAYTITDAAGNTATCNFTVTVIDNELPTIACPANVSVNNDAGVCTAIVNGIAPTTSGDNCSVASVTYTLSGATISSGSNDASGETFNLGATTVTYTITDGTGNTANCSFTVTVIDTEAPNISCPGNQNETPNASCQFTLPDYSGLATGLSDNCTAAGAIVVTQSPAIGTVVSTNTTITLTASDGNGNSSTCNFDVIIVDNTPPSITCPTNVSVNNDAGVCNALVNGIAPISSSDNCTVASITYTLSGATTGSGSNDASGETFNLGVTTVTYIITDGAGNSTNCAFTVTVSDNEAPSISCPGNQNESINASCQFILPDYTSLATGLIDNCTAAGSISVTQSPAIGTVISSNTTITLTANDGNGNTNTCTFDVLLDDTTPPTISCPANVSANNDAGVCTAVVNGIAPIASGDNCSVASITYTLSGATAGSGSNDASGETFNPGVTTVTYTITDGAGNSTNCAFTVTVIDNEAPSISNCPSSDDEDIDNNCEFTLPDYTTLVNVNDNCTAPGSITLTQSPSPGTVISGHGTIQTITITATDASGNNVSCSFDITLEDDTDPTIVCPLDYNEYLDANCEYVVPDFSSILTFNDNCTSSGALIFNQIPAPGTIFTGHNTVISIDIEVEDVAGNDSDCEFEITLLDTISPAITCPSNITANTDAGICAAGVSGIGPVALTNNCSGASITYAISGVTSGSGTNDASGETFNLGVSTVSYTITDGQGLSDACSFDVTVIDNEAPSITCPGNINQNNDAGNCNAIVSGLAPTTADNCGIASITYTLSGASTGSGSNDASGELFNVGTTTVSYTVTDNAGLTASCSFDVTVNDNELPIVSSCPNNITQCDSVVIWTAPSATDNCGIASINQTQGLSSGSTFPVGTTLVEYEISDVNGNISTCSFDITILPLINSTFWIPDTICLNGVGNIDLDDSTVLDLSIPESSTFYSDSSQVQINPSNMFNPQSTGPGTFPITHVVDNGFCTDTTTLVVTILPQYQSNFSGLDTLCAALDTFNLVNLYNGSSTQGGQFFGPTGANITQDTLWVLSGGSGIYDIGYTVGPGSCADTTIKQIYLSPDVDPNWQLVADSICVANNPIDLLPTVSGTVNATSYFTGNGITTTIFNPAGLNGQTILTYHVGEGQCQETQNDTVFVVSEPVIDAGPDLEVCGDTAVISGSSDTNLSWWTSNGDIVFNDSSQINGAIANLISNEGNYTVYLNADNAYCFMQDSLVITYYTPPSIVDAGPDQNLDYTFSTTMDATLPDFGSGQWNYFNNSAFTDLNDPASMVNNLVVGENIFYWVVSNGVCPSDSASIIVTVNDVYIPSGFSPNDDGKNDYFVIPGIENASSSSVQIFNRWGTEVFSAKNYTNNWNGQSKTGQDLVDDTYYYIVTIDERKFSGYIILRR